MKTYAAIYVNDEIRDISSSGGLFSALADQFDVVYGVAMTEDCYGAEMIRVQKNISTLRGSKYLQARIGDVFKQVKKDLEEQSKVIFTGTGCQINGLSLFLGKDYSNLFLLEIVCHGVPSPKLWKMYAEHQENKYGKLESVNFRYKYGSSEDYCRKDNEIYISKNTDSFMQMFLRDYCLRPACYECHAKYYKKADMTIADFWGIEKIVPDLNDGKGTSLIITRTPKGQALFDCIQNKLKWKEVTYSDGVKDNPSEYSSVVRPQQRDTFFKDLKRVSFSKLKTKYIDGPMWKRSGRKIKYLIKSKYYKSKKLDVTTVSLPNTKSNTNYGLLLTFKKK